jgi:hypothetical protein
LNGKANVGILGRFKLDMESNVKILEKIKGDLEIEPPMLSFVDNTKGEYKADIVPFVKEFKK